MTDFVSHPAHYTQDRFGIECIDVIRREVCTLANVVKYVWRHREKNGLEDLRKAEQYLHWAIEDGVSLTGNAQRLIWKHVEPVALQHDMDPVYRVIVDLTYGGREYAALHRLQKAIAEWSAS